MLPGDPNGYDWEPGVVVSPRAQPAPDEIAGPGALLEDAQNSAACGSGASDWPSGMPKPPPFDADDENREEPDEH